MSRTKKSLGFFLHTPASQLNGFRQICDREYYSQPRQIEVLGEWPGSGSLIKVREPVYGTFPADPANIQEHFEWV